MSVKFDNADDIIDISSFADISGALSISAWIKPISTGGGAFGRVIHIGDASDVSNGIIEMSATNTFGFLIALTSVAGEWKAADNALTMNVWQHICVTFAGTSADTPIFYVNGTTSAATLVSGTPSGSRVVMTQAHIGNRTSLARTFDGNITEVAVWNAALSSGNVTSLANGGNIRGSVGRPLTVATANLKAYWPLNDFSDGSSATSRTYVEKSGNANNGVGNWGANASGLISSVEQGYLSGMGQWGY